MAGGWQLIPAIQGEGTGQDTSMMAQARKMSEPTWTQKEQYKQGDKEENKDRLPGQDLDYSIQDMMLGMEKQKVNSAIYQYFYNHTGSPPAEMQQEWNQKLTNLRIKQIQLRSLDGILKQNYKLAEETKKSFITSGEKSTGNSLALTDVNGVPRLIFDPVRHKYLTDSEMVDQMYRIPASQNGQPVAVTIPDHINNEGDFDKYVNEVMDKVNHSTSFAGNMEQGTLYEEGDDKWMYSIMHENDEKKVMAAAKNIADNLEQHPSAYNNIARGFYKGIISAYQTGDGTFLSHRKELDKDGISVHKEYTGEDISTITKILTGSELNNTDNQRLHKMIKEYAQDRILSIVPTNVQTTDVIHQIKVTDTSNKVVMDTLTQIVTGDLKSEGPNNAIVMKGGQVNRTDWQSLGTWFIPPQELEKINTDMQRMGNTGGFPVELLTSADHFYTDSGSPNSMQKLMDAGASAVAVLGDVRQFWRPGGSKDDLKPIDQADIDKMSPEELKNSRITCIKVRVTMPSKKGDDFKKVVVDSDDKNIVLQPGIGDTRFYQKGVKIVGPTGKEIESVDYYDIFIPVTPRTLMSLGGANYAKGRQVAEKKLAAQRVQQTILSSLNQPQNQ